MTDGVQTRGQGAASGGTATGPGGPHARGQVIDGKQLAQQYRRDLAARVSAIRGAGGAVRLDAILVDSGDSAARQYAENQGRTCAELGIEYRLHEFDAEAGFDEIAGRVLLLNTKEECTAIMVHVPLPKGVEAFKIQRLIAPEKDVEGVNPANIGNIVYGQSSLVPCTALAVLKMIQSTKVDLCGKRVVVIGASDVVGKPIAVLLMRQDATVVSCNKHTWGLPDLARTADVLVAAAGVPHLVNAEMVKPGAVVIDVGVNRVIGPDGKSRTVGDVDFDRVAPLASFISPVPGGVGPMTVAMLLQNVVDAAARAG